MNNNQQHKSTPDHWAEVEAYAQQVSSTDDCLLELRSRVEALEGKYETQRLATLEWGKDVETLKLRSDRHLQRIERLEGIKQPASKVYEISEPLELTPEQAQHVRNLLTPNSKPTSNPSQIRSSLVEQVRNAIASEYDPKDYCWDEACAAIRVVATWLREQGTQAQGWAMLLEQEASNA